MAAKPGVQKVLDLLFASETVADKIMVNKQEIIQLDKRRQQTREAIREINKHNEQKVWTTIGSMLVKLDRKKALEMLEKDKVQIDSEINKLRSEQKILVNEHRDIEHKLPFKGSNLKPMNSKEMSALRANLPLGN
ncbi:p53 and DNA damage-regulated protein 1 isoform X2 [Hermetia illucens]|nr:p53 and DNA damage-regulated protein 1 isoform X2 [Hermetia illucens]